MKYALIGMCCLEVLDGGLTHWAVSTGAAREANALVAAWAGDWLFWVVKVIGSLTCALALWRLHRHFPRIALLSANSIVAFYASVLAWNLHLLL